MTRGRYVMVIGSIGGITFTFLNIYAPNEDCPNFFKHIASLLAGSASSIFIMAGDFNCVLNAELDKLPADRGPISKKSRSLSALIKEL